MDEKILFEIIADLQGTCQSLDDALDKHDLDWSDLSMQDFAIIDENIFECAFCNWWWETCDLFEYYEDENICRTCAEEHGYENEED